MQDKIYNIKVELEVSKMLKRLDDVEGLAEIIRYQLEKSTVRGCKIENAAQAVINYIKGE